MVEKSGKINKMVYFPMTEISRCSIPFSLEDQSWTLHDVVHEWFGQVVSKIGLHRTSPIPKDGDSWIKSIHGSIDFDWNVLSCKLTILFQLIKIRSREEN
jgi:hypothetical protein